MSAGRKVAWVILGMALGLLSIIVTVLLVAWVFLP